MPKQQIRATLSELHAELEKLDRVDPELEHLLRQVDDDIHALLASEHPVEEETGLLMQRVEALGADFAARHPQLERFFQEIVAVLGRLGI
ncbi:MAG TPA: DUF4404 family protein [Pseudomonadales bacterium]